MAIGAQLLYSRNAAIKKPLLLIIIFLNIAYVMYAQRIDANSLAYKNTQLTPAAAWSFRKVEFPSATAVGALDITIPLFEVSNGDIKVPVQLSYRTTGNKVNDPAGLVGMGWTLTAEPTISRQVKSLPDEKPGGYLTNDNLNSNYDLGNNSFYLYNWANGFYDEDPDDFVYNLLSGSGQFYYRRRNNTNSSLGYDIINKPLSNNKIAKTAQGFEITDDAGYIYTFPETVAETTSDVGAVAYKSTWKASQVVSSQTQRKVQFQYNTFPMREFLFSFTSNVVFEDYLNNLYNTWCNTNPDTYCFTPDVNIPGTVMRKYHMGNRSLCLISDGKLIEYCTETGITNSLKETDVELKGLKEIDFETGKLSFEYWQRTPDYTVPSVNSPLTGMYLVDNIKYFAKTSAADYSLVKIIKFYQDRTKWNRETLDSIVVYDANNIRQEAYKFEYDPQILHPFPATSYDHWGYWNTWYGPFNSPIINRSAMAQVRSCMVVPYDEERPDFQEYPVWLGDNDKVADPQLAKAKILTKIIYPTGGSQSFEYELNRWRDYAGNEYTGGGLRIKKVIANDAVTSTNNIREFKYGLGEDGFGIGEAVNPDHYVLNKKLFYLVPDGNFGDLMRTERRIFMCNPIMNYFFAGGSPVVYPETAEYYGAGQNVNGKIINRYDYNYFFTRYSFERVVPFTTLAYDYRDACFYGQLLEKVFFRKTANGFDSIQKQIYEYEDIGSSVPASSVVRKIYFTADNGDGGATPSFNNTYAQYYEVDGIAYELNTGFKRLKKQTSIDYSQLNGVVHTSEYKYDGISSFYPRKIISVNSKGESIVNEKRYPFDYNTTIMNSLKLKNILKTEIENKYYKDNNGQLIDLESSLIDFKYNASSDGYLPASISLSNRGQSYELFQSMDAYDSKSNVVQVTNRNGIRVSYIWNALNQTIAEVVNTHYENTGYTSFETDDVGSWNIAGAQRNTANAITGTQSYDLSNGVITKSGLDPNKSYTFSFWAKPGANVQATGTQTTVQGSQHNGWIFWEKSIIGVNSLEVSGSGLIDEIRLLPNGSQMKTSTYGPFGITSQCDINNQITYYEYDGFGRLSQVLDQDRQIIKKITYQYAGE